MPSMWPQDTSPAIRFPRNRIPSTITSNSCSTRREGPEPGPSGQRDAPSYVHPLHAAEARAGLLLLHRLSRISVSHSTSDASRPPHLHFTPRYSNARTFESRIPERFACRQLSTSQSATHILLLRLQRISFFFIISVTYAYCLV